MTLEQFIQVMENIAPLSLELDFDNSGLQCGVSTQKIEKILLALDCTGSVLDEAVQTGADLILTHHPLIWEPLKRVDDSTRVTQLVRRLINEDIAVFSAHTNLDIVDGGVCDVLADIFELKNIEKINPDEDGEGYGRIGDIKPMSVGKLASIAKERLSAGYVRYTGDEERTIGRLAVASGSGSSCFADALKQGAQCIITGDVPYSAGLDYPALGMSIVDAGHFASENVVLPKLIASLQREFNKLQYNVEMQIAKKSVDAFSAI